MRKLTLLILVAVICNSCNMIGAGTLGTFREWTFPVSEQQFDQQISFFFKHNTQYIIPKKWEHLDSWEERGYAFLNGKIFYFANSPEEMYYVSYAENRKDYGEEKSQTTTTIAVRAVTNGNPKERWNTIDDFENNKVEVKRTDDRFGKEIITSLEKQMHVKSEKQTFWYEYLSSYQSL